MLKDMPKNGLKQDIDNMRLYRIVLFPIICYLLYSCDSYKNLEQPIWDTEGFLTELALVYWDLNYKFPTSYMQSRDTQAWFFPQCLSIDSMLLCQASEIKYTNEDSSLLITYNDDTLAYISLPCTCDRTDEIPLGPRAYDSLDNLILADFIQVGENCYLGRLTYDLVNEILPDIEKKMNALGFTMVQDGEKEYPRNLIIEYIPAKDSIQLNKACEKYRCYFYDAYVNIVKNTMSEYCKKHHVSRLLTFIDVYKR